MDIDQAKELLQRYREGNCTPSENKLLESWYQQLIKTGEWQWGEGEREMIREMLEARLLKQINVKAYRIKSPVSPLRRRWWAAASVILLIGVSAYFLYPAKTTKPVQTVQIVPDDIKAPQSNRATITLANGQKVFLDSMGNGALAVQGNVDLVKLEGGKLAYQKNSGEISGKMRFNILSNPNGSQIVNIVLADGSRVWLNAGSTLRYPVLFMGNERKVSVTGEAYFEIAHDASKPFIVSNGSLDIRVLGTHFNVNAFEDDGNDIKITLLEGSVKVKSGKATGLLKPGQQARVNKEIRVVSDVDVDMVMAWKNGYFQFENASLQTVLKQVSRWYGVDVVYEGNNQPRQFVGEMQRDLSLREILKILEKNDVHFSIIGKKLIVIPD